MKPIATALLTLALLTGCVAERRPEATTRSVLQAEPALIEQLRRLDRVSGLAVGYAGEEGEFSRLFRQLNTTASDAQIREMLDDARPPMRLMGFVLGIHRWPAERPRLVEHASRDTAEVTFHWGCDLGGQKVSIAELVAEEMIGINAPLTPRLLKIPPKA